MNTYSLDLELCGADYVIRRRWWNPFTWDAVPVICSSVVRELLGFTPRRLGITGTAYPGVEGFYGWHRAEINSVGAAFVTGRISLPGRFNNRAFLLVPRVARIIERKLLVTLEEGAVFYINILAQR